MSTNYTISTIIHQFKLLNPSNFPTLIACSGGLDSMALAYCLNKMKDKPKKLSLAYVHHGIRSQEEENKDLSIIHSLSMNMYKLGFGTKNLKSEHEARKHRYNLLNDLALDHGYAFVVTAHHADDQLETRIINMCRGKNGSKPMLSTRPIIKDSHVLLIRPCLTLTKEHLRRLVVDRQIPYNEDITNNDIKYTRNRIRKEIIPVLKQLYPRCAEHSSF